MSQAYSLYFGLPTGPRTSEAIISERPSMPLSGVLNSWLMWVMKSVLARFAASAAASAWCSLSAWTSSLTMSRNDRSAA